MQLIKKLTFYIFDFFFQIFLGLGFPYEGPAPLEAIANGAVFINPKFAKPHNRNTVQFFKGKPTEREVIEILRN